MRRRTRPAPAPSGPAVTPVELDQAGRLGFEQLPQLADLVLGGPDGSGDQGRSASCQEDQPLAVATSILEHPAAFDGAPFLEWMAVVREAFACAY